MILKMLQWRSKYDTRWIMKKKKTETIKSMEPPREEWADKSIINSCVTFFKDTPKQKLRRLWILIRNSISKLIWLLRIIKKKSLEFKKRSR